MRISVALTTYNGSRYIIKQLDSIVHQSRFIDEIIIVDDCSTDDTTDLILAYIKAHNITNMKLYINRENIGYKRNFKEALYKATGDYIFLCDQDDIWSDKKVDYMVKVMVKHPEILCLNSAYHLIDEEDHRLEDKLLLDNLDKNEILEITTEEILIKNISMGCTMCIDKKIKDIYLEMTNSLSPHDWEMNAIASFYNGLYYFNHPLTYYRLHSSNTVGLDVGEQDDKKNARKKNSIQIDSYLSGLNVYKTVMSKDQYEYLQLLQSFSQRRTMLLNGGSKKIWFSLIKQFNIYKQYVSIKGMLVELFM